MQFFHFFFTSTKIKGLGVLAHSAGMNSELLETLTRLCLYKSPNDLPSQPSEKAIVDLFPVAYGVTCETSGINILFKSHYLGKDFTNRYGNYLAEAYVTERNTPKSTYWVDWLWYLKVEKRWKMGLSEKEEAQLYGKILPLVKLELEITWCNYFEKISDFIAAKNNRIDKLCMLLNAVLAQKTTAKKIIIVADKDDLLLWCTAIHYSFPLSIANNLSFVSYRKDYNSGNFNIVGLTPENTREIKEVENNNGYCYFNFCNENLPELRNLDYTACIRPLWINRNKEAMIQFFRGLPKKNNEEIDIEHPYFFITSYDKMCNPLFIRKCLKWSSLKQLYNLIKERFGRENVYDFMLRQIDQFPKVEIFKTIFQQGIVQLLPEKASSFYKHYSSIAREHTIHQNLEILDTIKQVRIETNLFENLLKKIDRQIDTNNPGRYFGMVEKVFSISDKENIMPRAYYVQIVRKLYNESELYYLKRQFSEIEKILKHEKISESEKPLVLAGLIPSIISHKDWSVNDWEVLFDTKNVFGRMILAALLKVFNSWKENKKNRPKTFESCLKSLLVFLIKRGDKYLEDLETFLKETRLLTKRRKKKILSIIEDKITDAQLEILNQFTQKRTFLRFKI